MNSNASSTIAPDRLAKLEYMVDRQEILDCLTRVARGADRSDREIYLSAFHPDATIHLPNRSGPPSESIEKGITHLETAHYSSFHNLLNHTCEISGDVAHSETYYLFLGRNRDETNRISGGRYLDRLERRDGQWKIALRRVIAEYAGVIPPKTVPLIDALVSKLEIDATWAPSRGKNDPSYRRP